MTEQPPRFRWLVLALLFLNIFFATVAMQCVPPLFKEIAQQMPLTKAQMGLIMGALTLASLIFAPIGGALSDRIGSRWAFGMAILIIAGGSALRAAAGSVTSLVCFMFIMGAGIAVVGPNMPKALGMWFPKSELAMANGIAMASMGIGGALAMGISATVLSPVLGGWRNIMMIVSVFVLASGVLWIFFFREQQAAGAEKPRQNIAANFKKVLGVKDLWLLAAFYAFNMVGLMSTIALLPATLEERGIANAGVYVSIMMGATVVFNIVGGLLSDRTGKRKPFLLASAAMLGLCFISFVTVTGVPLIAALVLAGAALGTIATVLMIIPVELETIGPQLAATAVGLIFMIGNTAGFIGPIVSGKLIDVTGSAWGGFLFMGAALFFAAACIIPLTETGRKARRAAGHGGQ
jgi:cyanate permease